MRALLALLAIFLIAGCQTTGGSTVGSGPITLSPVIQNYFDKYLANHGSIFAVAIDGRSGLNYYYCPDVQCREHVGERQLVIDGCEEISQGVPCKIYAVRDKIVWDFDGPPLQ